MFFGLIVEVPESEAIVLEKLGGYSRTLVAWKDYFISAEDKDETDYRKDDVLKKTKETDKVKKEGTKPLIGNYFWKIPVLEKIYSYELEWKENHYRKGQDEKKGERNTESFSSIDLKQQVFVSSVDGTTGSPAGAESTDLTETSFNRLDVDVEYLVTMRVVNPYIFLFDSPGNSFDEVMDYLDTRISDIISQCEVNLLKRLKGSGEALWWGLGNPEVKKDKSEYYRNEYYPEINDDEEFEALQKKQKTLWAQYKKDISYSDNVEIVFKGLKNDRFIAEKCHDWGIEIDPESIEITRVHEPETIKKAREEAVEKEAELTKRKTEKKMAKVEAETAKIKGQGIRSKDYEEMRAIDDLAKLFRKYGEGSPLESAIMVKKAYLAADKGQLKEINIKGLEGGSIASIAAQLGIGKELRSLFGNGNNNDNRNSSTEAGFKPEKKEEKTKKKEEKTKIELLDKDGNPFYSSTK